MDDLTQQPLKYLKEASHLPETPKNEPLLMEFM
jgi:hypothetical protein